MANYGWDVVPGKRRMPAAGETVNGEPFSVPRNALVMAIAIPSLAGGTDTLKLQSLVWAESNLATEIWQDLSTFNLATGDPIPLSLIPQSATTTIPITATGAGVLRLVASADQSSAPVDILITFMCL